MPRPTRTTFIPASALAALALAAAVPAPAAAFSWTSLFGGGTTTTATTPTPAPTTTTSTTGCPAQAVTKAFAFLGDTADYSLAPGGDFESSAGWTFTGGAKIVSGNENLGVAPGSKSLSLPLRATATSPAFCVDASNPYFRFVSKPDNAVSGYTATVIYTATDGSTKSSQFTSSASQSWSPGTWSASSTSPLAIKIPAVMAGNIASVQIKFTSTGNTVAVGVGTWGKFAAGSLGTVSFDSLMVDPYRRG